MSRSTWLSTLYERFRRELFLAAWTVLRRGDLAEDAVHAAFVKLIQLDSPPVDPKLYVFRCVRNAAIDLARARSRRREEPLQAEWDGPCPPTEMDDVELSRLVGDVIERLDEASREVIELHVHAALSFQEISELLDEPLPTVASRYRRALGKISNQIKVHHE
jgi:RNA polymerase sigma-70 factor (ECF subfamily)